MKWLYVTTLRAYLVINQYMYTLQLLRSYFQTTSITLVMMQGGGLRSHFDGQGHLANIARGICIDH